MNRNQCNLYINHISDITTEERLISYFSQFGKIESYTFFNKTSRRNSAAAIITYESSVNINYIIKNNQWMKFDDHHLYLRRTLPLIRPAYERFMSSNELLISLNSSLIDEEFNEKNIRKYFSKYGSIVSCRNIIYSKTFLIDFVETNSVDCAILDEPHFYNKNELILRKYVSPDRIKLFYSKRILFDQKNNLYFFEKIRRLNDIIEAIQFGQKIQLKLIKCSYEEKKFQFNKKQNNEIIQLIIQLKKIYDNKNEDILRIKKKNQFLKLMIEQNQRIKKYIIDLYEKKIEDQQNHINQLKKEINSLNLY